MAKNIKVKVIGPLKEQINVDEVFYDGATLKEVVDQFVEEYQEKLTKYINAKTGVLKYIMIILNKKHYLMLPEKLNTVLQPDDCVTLTLPVGGG